MPDLPLPVGERTLTGGDVPVRDASDVLAEFPRPHKNPETAPVRDAFTVSFADGFITYQDIAARAAGQCDPLLATGDNLKGYAEEHAVIPGVGESEESVRSRLFKAPEIVAPDIIIAGVNAFLAPFTTGTCRLSELELDGMFAHDGTAVWDCFVGAGPDYPDRYYNDVPSADPGGAIPSQGLPRSFLLRIPDLESNDDNITYVLNGSDDGIFIDDGSGSFGFYGFVDPKTAEDLYETIIGYVESIKGQGVSWTLLIDPTL